MPIIYLTTNNVNGKIYVGKDKHNDPSYFGSGTILRQAIKKYGKANFSKEILESCSEHELNNREAHWIKTLNSTNRNIGYNRTRGGDGGDTISMHPNRIAIGLHHSEYLKNNHPTRGKKLKPLSTEQKAFLSARLKNNNRKYGHAVKKSYGWTELNKLKFSLKRQGSGNPFFGKAHSDIAKEKIRIAISNKPKTEEHKEKLSIANLGKIPTNSLPIIIDGVEYASMQEGARLTNTHYSTLRNRLKSSKFPNVYLKQQSATLKKNVIHNQ